MGTPLTGASNAGRNRDSEPICLPLTLQQASCCKHGHRWNTATISQVVTIMSLVVYCGYSSATCDKVTVSVVLQREIKLYALVNPKLK